MSKEHPTGRDVPESRFSADVTHTFEQIESLTPDSMIGPYRLLQMIGEGGMGVVWLTEQKFPVWRRVALKIIRSDMNSREVIVRFQAERQALAVMDHPTIAKVFDAGSTVNGIPYFVMEYVPGVPITDYCDRHRLSMRERLNLFVQVCEGIQHAHQKAIIHRDLKPSNILVTEIDTKAVAKIIDFGVAKATSQRLTPDTMFTRLGALIGTPEYMSPEQADTGAKDIDTRSDVYSLGVIFYELLVGTRPLDFSDIRNLALEELLRRLREDDVPRPSTRIKTLGDRSSLTAQNRQAEPAALGKELRGDLDAIALKALEKDRTRRYGSASELAADIRRYLKDEPILASPPSLPYRAHKFARRYRGAVLTASILALAIVGFAIVMAIQSARIARERDRANGEAEAAERVSDFLVGIFKISDPDESRGNKVTAREILDRGAQELDTKLTGQPQLQARLLDTIARVYEGLGLYEPAKHLVQKAVQIRQGILGPEHRDTLSSQRLRARLEQYQGHYADAEKLYQQILAIQQRSLGPEHADTLRTESALGSLYSQEGRYTDAQRVLSRVVNISRKTKGDEHSDTLVSLHNLAIAYDGLHEYAKEEKLWSDLVGLRTRVLGQDHPDTLASVSNLAYVYYRQGKLAEAEGLQRQTLEIGRRLHGPDHPAVLTAMGNLANTLTQEHRLAEAETLQRTALEGRRRVLGPDNPDTLFAMNNLAELLEEEGKYKEAETLFRETLDGETRVLGENHPEIGYVWYNLSGIAALQGDRDQAFKSLRQAIDHGYSDPEEMASDDAWKSLRNDNQYQSLFAEVRRKSHEHAN